MDKETSDAMDDAIKSSIFPAIKFREVGTERIRLEVDMTAERFFSIALKEHGRVFVFECCSFDPETGKAVVELVPGNGIARVQEMKEVQA